MRAIFLLIFAFFTFVMASALLNYFNIEYLRPDLLSIFILYLTRTRPPVESLLSTIILAIIFSAFANGMASVFVLQAILLMVSIRALLHYIAISHPLYIMLFLFITEICLQIFFWGLIALFLKITPFDQVMLTTKIMGIAISTAIIGPFIMVAINRLEGRIFKTFDDELYLLN